MTDTTQAKILVSVEKELKSSQTKIHEKISELKDFADKLRRGLLTWYRGSEDVDVIQRGIAKSQEEVISLETMLESPYFFKADVKFADETNERPVYISKFSLPEHRIYSWVSPIACLRYANPGEASYILPSGTSRSGFISRKDNYLIREHQLYKFSYATTTTPTTLVINKPFKANEQFGLTEIIEKLDAYQDDIIRIEPAGSMLISGAAGSGKTTLALHRMAFLHQNIQTAFSYPIKGMLVFVQDEATKNYFASILPNLSLKGVTLTTFAEWAFKLLNLTSKNYIYSEQLEHPDHALLIYAKHQALLRHEKPSKLGNLYDNLSSAYFDYFDEYSFEAFKKQKSEKILDRFDLTLLLEAAIGEIKTSDLKQLIVIDEAENYLPGSLAIIKQFRDPTTAAMIYIGDLVQRTFPFTMRHWEQINENFATGRKIVIPKVYRISHEIRKYLESRGYAQDMSTSLHHGPEVLETTCNPNQLNQVIQSELENFIKQETLNSNETRITGILSNSPDLFSNLRTSYPQNNKLHFLSIHEAQGVEFDTVLLFFKKQSSYPAHWPHQLTDELEKVERDLFLVGVTRARFELKVFLLED